MDCRERHSAARSVKSSNACASFWMFPFGTASKEHQGGLLDKLELVSIIILWNKGSPLCHTQTSIYPSA